MPNEIQTLRKKLLADARAHCHRTNISLAALAYRVAGNTHIFERIEKGGDVTTRTYEQFQAYFLTHGGAPPAPPDVLA